MLNLTLRPSHAYRWVNCPASVKLIQQFGILDKSSTMAAEEGIAAHDVASQILLNKFDYNSHTASNGVPITEDMIFYGEEYKKIILNWEASYVVEQPLSILEIHPELKGTPDCYSIEIHKKLIRIIDYKYGFRPVDPYLNWQLICYLSGIITKIKAAHFSIDEEWVIEFIIYQPRINHSEGIVRNWVTTLKNIFPHFTKLKNVINNEILSEIPVARTGSHCLTCSARHVCSTLQKSNYHILEFVGHETGNSLDLGHAGYELTVISDAIDILKARQTALELQLEHALRQNEISDHYTLERVKTRDRWQKNTEQQLLAIGKILNKDLTKPIEILSPTQCRKQGLPEQIIQKFLEPKSNTLKLVKRDTNQTKRLFDH